MQELDTLHALLRSGPPTLATDQASLDQRIAAIEAEQERTIADMHALSGRARLLLREELQRLEEELAHLQQHRQAIQPELTHAERTHAEVDAFFQWCHQLRGHVHDATYQEKRTIFRLFGITARIFQEQDRDHERYLLTARPTIIDRLFSAPTPRASLPSSSHSGPMWSQTATL